MKGGRSVYALLVLRLRAPVHTALNPGRWDGKGGLAVIESPSVDTFPSQRTDRLTDASRTGTEDTGKRISSHGTCRYSDVDRHGGYRGKVPSHGT